MPKYFEQRSQSARGTDSIAADIMRHLYARQHLGKAIIVCEQPVALLSAARKQWLKLSRSLQKRRASTLNADKILKYTHAITRMQHMLFSHKSPLDHPEAEVYFLRPGELNVLPIHCWTTYVLTHLNSGQAEILLAQLPADALITDYCKAAQWERLGCAPKKMLEQQVTDEWRQVRQFLQGYQITIEELDHGELVNIERLDDALDTLLGVSHRFLQTANEFQRVFELARPLRLIKAQRQHYDTLLLLAHRVQALSPGIFTQRFLETYNEDDTFFLYDPRGQITGESLSLAVQRHMQAGRLHLAAALRRAAESAPKNRHPTPPIFAATNR